MMKRVIRALIALLALALALPEPALAWAHGRGFHRHRTLFVGAFFVGAPVWYAYHRPPYYYGPGYEASDIAPAVYVEKFEGAPSAESGEIFCPRSGQYYPDIQECPAGWQRIIRPTEPTAQGD